MVSHPAFGAPKNAIARLSVCGLGTVKSWLAPYETLSGGQRARVDVALSLTQQRGALIEDLGRRLDPHSVRALRRHFSAALTPGSIVRAAWWRPPSAAPPERVSTGREE